MPRTTRSKKADISILDDNTAQQITLEDQFAALNEINNAMAPQLEDADAIDGEVKILKDAYREAVGITKKGKKGKGKKGKVIPQDYSIEVQEVDESVAPDCKDAPSARESAQAKQEEQQFAASVRTTRRQAAKQRTADEALSQSTEHKAVETVEEETEPIPQGSPKTLIKSTVKKTLEEVEEAEVIPPQADTEEESEDSFVEQIVARSPAKHVSRIEDSVEALDQLEDALEALGQATLGEIIAAPEKPRPATPQKTPAKPSSKVTSKKSSPAKSGHATVRVKPTAPKQTVMQRAASVTLKSTPSAKDAQKQDREPVAVKPATKRPISMVVPKTSPKSSTTKRPVSMIAPKGTVRSTKPPTRPNFELPGEAVARKLKEQREARMAERQSSEDSFHTARVVSVPKVKSSKPTTKADFELPGEAISRKKKEAHEARLKAQEEEERKRREFKARPVPNFVPRETAASKSRQSRVGVENEDENLTVAKRGSNIGAHRPSILQLAKANTSAPRAPGPAISRKPSPTLKPGRTPGAVMARKPSPPTTTMSGLPLQPRQSLQRTVSAAEVTTQKQRGREIYNRDTKLAEDIQRERDEREAAAKRAREEAAERGRQASREWAAKQIAKKMAEGDKGLTPGYGPGGQLGLTG